MWPGLNWSSSLATPIEGGELSLSLCGENAKNAVWPKLGQDVKSCSLSLSLPLAIGYKASQGFGTGCE